MPLIVNDLKEYDDALHIRINEQWTSHATADKLEPQNKARSNALGLKPPADSCDVLFDCNCLDLIKHTGTNYVWCYINALAYPLPFQLANKGFRYCVIPAIASTIHSWEQFIGITKPFPVIASVLATLV